MRYGSVCSGIEAATVAWHPLGWEPAWFAEIDAFPSRVLAHHYPQVPNHGDFTGIGADAGPIDLLVGGTPCQAFSIAGLREGLDDERGNLALEYCRLAARLRPRWLVWENVPGVLSSWSGAQPPSELQPGERWEGEEKSDFGCFVNALVELGYGIAYRVLDAQFCGVPQRRRRVFIVGYLGDWRRAAGVLFESESLRGNSPTRREAGAEAPRGVAVSVGGHVAHTLRGEGFDASEDGTGRGNDWRAATGSPIPFDTTQITSRTNRAHPKAGDTGHPLAAQAHPPAIVFHLTQDPISSRRVAPAMSAGNGQGCSTLGVAYGRNNTSGPIPTAGALTAKGGTGRMDFETETFILQHQARRLTPRECERLQGFPDDYTAIPGAADGPRYKALGNSMAVPVMRWIGQRIQRIERIVSGVR
ncbi:cytosine-specific methyltransferase [Myxococcus stipitatus DSM 14675]|uniref:Cytosine-specific methyltransferase n=1 Tax=Myxococcus stipitatus (strain DSM 14675 / JCM 12634 / Mx s8) TaxID=1278073 RepID=L7U617_MYXSD|nr:DNA cytosine methyltransferase [Myxococcus stipitatus]AGC43300.1 cytosine-specific methyltransferase [Myxococcus stipitatus DSM 14675]